MSANIPKNSAQKARKKARKQAADTARKRSLTVTNGLLATGTCCLIVASMLIMYSKTRALTFGMPGGLFLCALGAGCVGLSYFDVEEIRRYLLRRRRDHTGLRRGDSVGRAGYR